MSWVNIAIMVAGSVVQGQANKGAQKKQQALINESDVYQKSKTANAQKSIDAYLKTLQPEARDAARLQSQGDLRENLQETVGAVEKFAAPQVTEGKVSKAFTDRINVNRAANADRVGREVDRLSIIGAPGQTALRDATAFGRSAMDAGAEYDAARNVGSAYTNAASNVRPNSMAMLLAQGMQAYGMGKMLGGKGAPPQQPPAPVRDLTPGFYK